MQQNQFSSLSSLRFPGNFPISSGICFMLKIYWVITNLYLLCYLSFWLMVKFALMIHYETLSKWSQLLVSSDSKNIHLHIFFTKEAWRKKQCFHQILYSNNPLLFTVYSYLLAFKIS